MPAQHDYATAGARTLTVMDDDGARGVTTRTVNPTAGGSTTVASDLFDRVMANGWGTADVGGSWTVSAPASAYSVASGAGRAPRDRPRRLMPK